MRHIIPISGKDSLATAIVQIARAPKFPYEYIYNDTHMELPETYKWLTLVERTLNIQIVRKGKDLETIILEEGILPSPRRRFCTRLSKIYPMLDYIGNQPATIYLGIRADEDRIGQEESKGITIRYPLRELHINLPMVYQIVDSKGLRPPQFFWQRLFDEVLNRMGTQTFVIDELPRWMFDRVFAWRSRPNCFSCFYQRRYEWVGLLEHHPELFDKSEALELEIGAGVARTHPYYWIAEDMPLSRIRDEAESIFQKRVKAVCDFLRKRLQGELWAAPLIDELDMAQTSCGLYCGK